MKPRRIWAVARKEFLHVLRDPRSLGMAIAIPMLLLTLYGYALTLDVDNVPMVVWDQSPSPASREFISRFQGSRFFLLRGYANNYREVERAIDSGRALMALIIPTGFAGQVASGRTAQVQLIVDGSDSNTATLATGYAEIATGAFSQEISLRAVQRMGAPALRAPLDLRPRVWFNADLESKNFLIPGLIAVIMMIIAGMLTSLTMAREWERGTMEQLISTPVKGPELILGKMIPYWAVGMCDMVLAMVVGRLVFRVPLRGSVALLFAIAAIFLAGALALGMLISTVAKNQLLANQAAMVLTFLPSLLLSGFVYAISNMPLPIQLITYLVPARYFVALLKGIYLKGAGLAILGGEAALLALFAAGMMALANLKFQKRLA